MKVLVCNAGSTSLKCKLYRMPQAELWAEFRAERVGEAVGTYCYRNHQTKYSRTEAIQIASYAEGIQLILTDLVGGQGVLQSIAELDAIGFKTVMAKGYQGVHALTEAVLNGMRAFLPVAPVHNAAYLETIKVFKEVLPQLTMVGVFETAFHQSIPTYARMYGIPFQWYEKFAIQRMGFHGNSHHYIAGRIQELMDAPQKVISCHLGGSASICAIKNGASLENSFGFSPQAGLPHANRVGDFDLFALPYLIAQGYSLEAILAELSVNGGLKGISGIGGDLRDIEAALVRGNARAKLAIESYCHEIIKYIGSYVASLGGLDVIVFTGGIGENSEVVRKKVCDGLSYFGVSLDEEQNKGRGERRISGADSKVAVYVVPADEEIGIARQTYRYVESGVRPE